MKHIKWNVDCLRVELRAEQIKDERSGEHEVRLFEIIQLEKKKIKIEKICKNFGTVWKEKISELIGIWERWECQGDRKHIQRNNSRKIPSATKDATIQIQYVKCNCKIQYNQIDPMTYYN